MGPLVATGSRFALKKNQNPRGDAEEGSKMQDNCSGCGARTQDHREPSPPRPPRVVVVSSSSSSKKEKEQQLQQGDPTRELFAAGVRPMELCQQLAARFSAQRIAEVIEKASGRAKSSLGGFIRNALEKGWEWPSPPAAPPREQTNAERLETARRDRERADIRYAEIRRERAEADRLAAERAALKQRENTRLSRP